MKKVMVIFSVVMFLFCANIVEAKQHRVTFKNSSNETVIYFLYRIDHNIKHISKPMAFVIGTLRPQDTWSALRDEGGHFYLEWKTKNDEVLIKLEPFELQKDITFTYHKLK